VAEPDEKVAWLVDGLLPAGGLSLVAGKPKAGKSTMVRNIALNVARGEPFLGRKTTQGVVLYAAFEEKRQDVKEHLRNLQAAGVHALHVYIGPLPPDPVAWLRAAIQQHGAALVILDTFGRFLRVRDLNDYSEVTRATDPIIKLAHETGAHIHCLHHAGKGERQGTDAALGSTALTGFVDTVFILKRHGDNMRTLETIQRTGTDLPETVVTLDADGRVALAGSLDARRVSEAVEAVVNGVGPETRTEEAILEAIGGDRATVGKGLREALRARCLVRAGAGRKGDPFRYYLPDENLTEEGSPGRKGERENPTTRVSPLVPLVAYYLKPRLQADPVVEAACDIFGIELKGSA
jgi:hypothetical protein